MATKTLLPGTNIEVIDKYVPGKRLDFPDSGEVSKVTFAKGTISAFKVTGADPLYVYPKVKVKIDDVESDDYLPIFYHPKALYWDDGDFLATDFNDEVVYFEKAWMSFQTY